MLCWLNGEIMEAADARISPFDRGFLFGDGVYEVVQYFNRTGVGLDLHIARLEKSLRDASLEGFDARAIEEIGDSLLEAGSLRDAIVYLQVTRGEQMPRAHLPKRGAAPTVFAYAIAATSLSEFAAPRTISAIVMHDDRWRRCAIKSTSLIANVLAAMEGDRAGAQEVILHRDGVVTEGSMTNVFIVRGGRVATPPVDTEPSILAGVTRALLIESGLASGVRIEERPVRIEELGDAEEIFITSTRRIVDGVGRLDGRLIGSGKAGPVTCELFNRLTAAIAARCGSSLHLPV
jgi:D-alanine transaminase